MKNKIQSLFATYKAQKKQKQLNQQWSKLSDDARDDIDQQIRNEEKAQNNQFDKQLSEEFVCIELNSDAKKALTNIQLRFNDKDKDNVNNLEEYAYDFIQIIDAHYNATQKDLTSIMLRDALKIFSDINNVTSDMSKNTWNSGLMTKNMQWNNLFIQLDSMVKPENVDTDCKLTSFDPQSKDHIINLDRSDNEAIWPAQALVNILNMPTILNQLGEISKTTITKIIKDVKNKFDQEIKLNNHAIYNIKNALRAELELLEANQNEIQIDEIINQIKYDPKNDNDKSILNNTFAQVKKQLSDDDYQNLLKSFKSEIIEDVIHYALEIQDPKIRVEFFTAYLKFKYAQQSTMNTIKPQLENSNEFCNNKALDQNIQNQELNVIEKDKFEENKEESKEDSNKKIDGDNNQNSYQYQFGSGDDKIGYVPGNPDYEYDNDFDNVMNNVDCTGKIVYI